VSVASFKEQGYLPEAMVSYMSLLGWGPPDGVEQRPLAELVDVFSLEDVHPSPAFFDVRKLQAFNGDHIRALTADEFVERARPFLTRGAETEAVLRPIAELVRDRVKLLTEVEPMVEFLLDGDLAIDEASWQKGVAKLGDRAAAMLDAAIEGLSEARWDAGSIEAALDAAARASGFVNSEGRTQMSKAQAPVRVATTGRSVGPPLYESLVVLGRERTLERLRNARARL
jgi:glutamyl-tRNA synthetase